MLNEHPDICWDGEILKERKREDYRQLHQAFDFKALIQAHERRCLKSCFGFEMKYVHIRELGITKSQFLNALNALHFTHFIVLTRRNHLRQHVSGSIAQITGQYHVGRRKTPEHIKVTLDVNTLVPLFRHFDSDFAEIQSLLVNQSLNLTYEEDIEHDPTRALKKICLFIRKRYVVIHPRLKRINSYPLSELIENYDEVVATLQETPYAWMLERQ